MDVNENNTSEITREELHNTNLEHNDKKKSKMSKKHKKIIIVSVIVLCVLVIGLVSVLVLGGKDKNKSTKTKKTVVESEMSEKEFKAIVDAYGDAVTLATNNYMTLKNGEIPKFSDIKDSVIFDKHKVVCATSKINFDGSVYLNKCTIDKKYSKEYSYGEEKEETKKSGDKIFLYKRNDSDSGSNMNTGAIYNVDKYVVSAQETIYGNYTLVDTYECENKKCKGYDYSELNNKVIIYDGEYYLYDLNSKDKIKLNVDNKEYNSISYVDNSNKIFGISFRKNDKYYNSQTGCALYSIDNNKFVTGFDYGHLYALDSKNIVFANLNEDTVLINQNSGSVERTINGIQFINEAYVNGEVYYYASLYSDGPNYDSIVLNNNLDRIIPYDDYNGVFNSDSTITVSKNNDNHFYIYDLNGNLIYTSKEYKSIQKTLKDYVVVLTNDSDLVLLNRSDEVLTTFLKVTDKHYLHPLISGWYTNNGKNGIYFVVGDNDIPYGTEGSGLEYYYIPSTGETGVIKTEGVGGYAKPVLYLYPTKKTKVEVSFEKPELLTTTYPKFNKKWSVTASKNGDLYDSKGKYYYGLYWEEEGSTEVDFSEGFYVSKDSAIDFLEEKLTAIGLNARERNEFIMYWLPILEKNEHNLVYFELTKEREKYNKLNISPKVDSLLRVAIHVKKVDGPTYIKEEKLETFKRKGFAAIEWGGVVHN